MNSHPTYGELLTAKEVCALTGFTMNQLRNWRTEHRRHLGPFGFLSIGGTSYYRKVVVEAWLQENGPQYAVYHPTEFDKKFPL